MSEAGWQGFCGADAVYVGDFVARAIEFPVPNVPRAVTEGEVRERFGVGWNVLHVGPAEFVNMVAAPTPAIVACVERV